MIRSFDPIDLVVLPVLDANSAQVLASSFEAAAFDENQNPRVLPDAVQEALNDVRDDRAALVVALGGSATTASDLPALDRREDAAIRAVRGLCQAWEHLAGELPEGDLGAELDERLFGDTGLRFLNLTPKKEWGVVETKLQTIDREGLEAKLAKLGGGKMLAHLRKVHQQYGIATGATQVSVDMTPQVREKYDALLESMRCYITAVAGSVQRKKPETKALADILLKPYVEWKSKPRRKADKGEASEEQGSGGEQNDGQAQG